jgi:hypothetical protein
MWVYLVVPAGLADAGRRSQLCTAVPVLAAELAADCRRMLSTQHGCSH